MYLLDEISLKIQWVSSSNIWAKVMKKLNKSMLACSGFSNLKQIAFWTLTAHWLLNSCNKVLWYKDLWHLSRETMFCDSRIALHFTCWVGVEQTSIFSCTLQFQNCGSHGKTLTCGTEDLTQIFAFLLCSTFFAIRTKQFKRWNAVLFFIGAVLGCKLIQYCFHRSWNTPKCAAAPKNDPSMARGRGALYPLPNLILIWVLFPLSIHSSLCGLWSISHPQQGWIKGIYDTIATAHGRLCWSRRWKGSATRGSGCKSKYSNSLVLMGSHLKLEKPFPLKAFPKCSVKKFSFQWTDVFWQKKNPLSKHPLIALMVNMGWNKRFAVAGNSIYKNDCKHTFPLRKGKNANNEWLNTCCSHKDFFLFP